MHAGSAALTDQEVPTLLLVDDEPGVLRSLCRALRSNEFRILTADGGSRALEILESVKVHVIVSDYKMPGLSGTDLLEKVRSSFPQTVRLILSGQADMDRIVDSMDTGGIYKFLAKPWDSDLLKANVREAFRRADEIVTLNRQVEKAAHTDALTGLLNRHGLKACFEHSATVVNSSILLVNLDRFRHLNSGLGQAAGDRVLVSLAERLASVSRNSRVARLTADEFAIFALGVNAPETRAFASRVIAEVRHPMELDGVTVNPACAIGAVFVDDPNTGFDDAMTQATAALSFAKHSGSNTYVEFSPDMAVHERRRSMLELELARAIEQQKLYLVYQPQYSLESGRMTGVEALIRWNHETFGNVSPAEFIPIAEQSGLIDSVGDWVIREALRQTRVWSDQLEHVFTVAVNVSPLQLNSREFAECARKALQDSGVDPDRIELELTESAVVHQEGAARTSLKALESSGFRFALDDFGTGYSTMANLRSLPFRKIKLDRSLVTGIDQAPACMSIAKSVFDMARGLDMKTTAEGVESTAELRILKELGCDYVQGFLLSRPVSETEIPALLVADVTRKERKP